MSLADIMQLQAIFGATIVVLEFPSGYIADRLGYRMSYPRWEGRVRAAAQVSEAMSSAIGRWLYALSPRLPVWLQVPVAAAGVAVLVATREVPSPASGERLRHMARAWHIVRHALIEHARLRSAILLSVALGVSTYVAVWLIQPWMRQRGLPIVWFGPLWALAHLSLVAVSLLSARLGEALGIKPALLICCLAAGAAYLGLGFSATAAGVIFYLGFMTAILTMVFSFLCCSTRSISSSRSSLQLVRIT
jgi:hypothetical protein